MSSVSSLIATPTLAPSIIAALVFGVELVGIGIRYFTSGLFEPYLYLVKLALIRTISEVMKIVWTRIADPSSTFILITEILSKVGSVFVLFTLFRTLTYWVRIRCYPGQIMPMLVDRALRFSLLIALVGQILGIVGIVEMMNADDYSLGVTLRDVSRIMLLVACGVFIFLVLMNSARARDPSNAFMLIILGIIATVRATYDVIAIIVPATSVIATSEIVQLCFDSVPEALAIGICIFYNLARVTNNYQMNAPVVVDDTYEHNVQYNGPTQYVGGQYQASYPQYSRKSDF
ncbi:hypothetical protein INT44_003877 [Umbelopsis vinacea]|uniref:Uncharacterized protein n=1 Tax=Umbelopsis vinacea TaxID=44442 RepID=A0A8H7UQX2_9FUNG|nr:hypothetical protein INT44_003877 [Umbelopsis vinacea]